MTRVSKRQLPTNELARLGDLLNTCVIRLNTKQKSELFLTDFLTTEEKIMLAKRLVIFIMLSQKYDTKTIQQALKVSYETIRTYKMQLRSKNKEFTEIINSLAKQDNTKELLKAISKLLQPFELSLHSKTNIKARAKLYNPEID